MKTPTNETEIRKLEEEKIKLSKELVEMKKKSSRNIALFLFVIGIIVLAVGIDYSSELSALVGIAITFWGVLFLYISPTEYIRKDVVKSLPDNYYSYLEKIPLIYDSQNVPFYFSPSNLWGLQNSVLVFPKKLGKIRVLKDFFSNSQLFLDNSDVILVKAPGEDLSNLAEKELGINFSTSKISDLENIIEKIFVENFELVKEIQIERSSSNLYLEMKGIMFQELVQNIASSKYLLHVGDPISSAIACILSIMTKYPVIIKESKIDGNSIQTTYEFLELIDSDEYVEIDLNV